MNCLMNTLLYKLVSESFSQTGLLIDVCEPTFRDYGKIKSLVKARFKKHKMEIGIGGSKKFELDIYLSKAKMGIL